MVNNSTLGALVKRVQMISLIALEVALCYRFLVSCYVYAQKGRTYIWASDVVMLQLSIDNWF